VTAAMDLAFTAVMADIPTMMIVGASAPVTYVSHAARLPLLLRLRLLAEW
jgi:hypothetical protein